MVVSRLPGLKTIAANPGDTKKDIFLLSRMKLAKVASMQLLPNMGVTT